ncbi:G-type lectin S-receptor-like serine/threonine-protein kinase At4g03230 [Morus notabilis]|uniref:G-type lectin S-receptor-like serine/threonine-protein kinase At4g03230 n=1 Tax=Morus notabilis TaxID=981085 RepID=UPI000CED556D|nr:G-type lectin S-receptor-like serine/threonine-protein kinase At4g03230 [Morus notabilis]
MDVKTNSASVISVLFLCLFLKTYFSLGADTISVNESVYGYSTIISAGSVFQLGFFKPGEAENYYVGIWYLKDPHKNIVWVAHRENPVTYSSELRISDGNLVLFNDLKIPIWSTNVRTTSSDSVRAVLLDSGNLVLTDGSNLSEPLWQSFDHPTNTWLPGAKLGYNKITKRSQVLTSWKNSEDPAPGLFSFKLDPRDNSYVILWNRSTKNWTSGSWNGETFGLAPEMTSYNIYEFVFVSNDDEIYCTYAINSSATNFSRHVMDVSGQIRQLTWLPAGNRWNLLWSQPRRQCDVYAYCGAYASCDEWRLPFCSCLPGFEPKVQSHWDSNDYSDGCLRRTRLQCGNNTIVNGEREKFLSIFNMSLPDNQQIVQATSLQDCEASCLNTCSCTAYAYESNNCSTWTGDLLNQRQLRADDSRGHTLYLRLAASEFPHLKRSSQNKKLYMLSILIVVIPCAACSVYYLRRKKRGTKDNRRSNKTVGLYDSEKHIRDFLHSGQLRVDEKKGIEVPFVVLDSILAATGNFSEGRHTNKLGQGGFGPVYRGKFPGGQEIAIKRLSSSSGQGLQEFKNEALLIAKLQHRNLVRLLGYCVEGDEKMLLYEYMPNKSLDFFLFDRKMCILLNWEIRFDIILGIAKGLLYLHHDSRLRIIHRDMKTSNVLLDGEMTPKISDFGLAKIFGGKQMEATTNRVVGTYGYMSPEYAIHGLFSIKSDVFSFGVVILEIISGKRNTGFYHSEEALSLLDYAWKLWNENKALDLIDPILRETCSSENEFMRCFNIGLLCVQDDPSDRPTMSNVVFMLGSESGSLPSPKQPAFLVKRSLSCRASFDEKPLSRNKLTDTLNEGR